MKNNKYSFAFDANEANVDNRVGSNVYAFEILQQFYKTTQEEQKISWTILLSKPPVKDLPKETSWWKYEIVSPNKFWTQWALPLYLFKNRKNIDLLYTPGHYAPRFSAVPYVSSVMDLAFLKFPDQFTDLDAFQLKNWTKYSVSGAQKVITISDFSKKEIIQNYELDPKKIVVAHPSFSLNDKFSRLRWKRFIKKNNIDLENYLLYLGTIQPRKNIEKLIESFEIFSRSLAAKKVRSSKARKIKGDKQPQLVIAGKTGWLADPILKRIENSPFKENIILTGFIDNSLKKPLYEHANASFLIGLYEGFGIPPLESLSVGTPAVVADNSSLPEAVGDVGFKVNPEDAQGIADAMSKVWKMPKLRRRAFERKAKRHAKKFSWEQTSKTILNTLLQVAKKEQPVIKTWDPFAKKGN